MPVTVNVNGLTVVHQTSNAIATATAPDVCLTPGPGGPVPVPYPNIALSSDLVGGTTSVTVDGSSAAIQGSKFIKSTGDEPGAGGGVMSAVFAMEATFISFSPTVMLDGKPVCRLTDKLLMNKSNTVCMGGALLSSLSDDAISSEDPKACVLRGVVVKCGHDARNLEIDLSKGDIRQIEIISKEDKPDTLLVEWDGTCAYGNPNCPTVGVRDGGKFNAIKQADGTAEMAAPTASIFRDPMWIFKALAMQKDIRSEFCSVQSLLCQGHSQVNVITDQCLTVQVFPEVSWKADMTLGYTQANAKKADGKADPTTYDERSVWTIGGSIEAKCGRSSSKFDASAKTGLGDGLPIFGGLAKNIGKLAKVFESMSNYGLDVTVKPRWPNWTIAGGGMKLIELKGKPQVGTEGSFKTVFEPLFGIELQASILDWMIRFVGGMAGPPGALLAQALVQVRRRFAKGAGDDSSAVQGSLDLDVAITVGGEIGGGFGFKFSEGVSSIDDEASGVTGAVDIKVEGHLIGKGRVWKVSIAGAGKIGAGGAETAGEASKVTARLGPKGMPVTGLKGSIAYNGLAFYYLFYVEYGTGGGEAKKSEAEEKEEEENGSYEVKRTSKKTLAEKKGTVVLIKPWTWPAEAHE